MWFTEDPWPPLLILAVLAIVSGIAWNATRRRMYLLATLGLIGLGFAVLVVEEMIVTESETVEALVLDLAEAVRQEDSAKVVEFVASEAKGLREQIRSQLERVEVQDDLRITDLHVTLEPSGTKALSHFRANGTITLKHSLSYTSPTRWNLTWQKTGESWRIIQVERLDPIRGDVISTWTAP